MQLYLDIHLAKNKLCDRSNVSSDYGYVFRLCTCTRLLTEAQVREWLRVRMGERTDVHKAEKFTVIINNTKHQKGL